MSRDRVSFVLSVELDSDSETMRTKESAMEALRMALTLAFAEYNPLVLDLSNTKHNFDVLKEILKKPSITNLRDAEQYSMIERGPEGKYIIDDNPKKRHWGISDSEL